MSAVDVASAALLAAGVAVDGVCAVCLPLLPTTYDRVHLLGPPSIVGSALIAAAVVVHEGYSPLGIKAILIALLLWAMSPVMSHATMRATRIRRGRWQPRERGAATDAEGRS